MPHDPEFDPEFDFDFLSDDEPTRPPRPLLTAVSILIVIGLLAVPVWVLWSAVRG